MPTIKSKHRLDVHFSSRREDWKTPRKIVDAIHEVLLSVDVDPCAATDNPAHTRAWTAFTKSSDGLSRPWRGRVFMNPPYGRGANGIMPWATKLFEEFAAERTTEAIALVPARTDTLWFNELLSVSNGYEPTLCFVRGRLKFDDGKDSAPFPSALVLLSRENATHERFEYVFERFGRIMIAF